MSGDDLTINGKCCVCDGAVPDFMIALYLPHNMGSGFAENPAHLARKVGHDYATINSVRSKVRNSCQLIVNETPCGAWPSLDSRTSGTMTFRRSIKASRDGASVVIRPSALVATHAPASASRNASKGRLRCPRPIFRFCGSAGSCQWSPRGVGV